MSVTYDDLGRKTSVVDPDRGTWSYTWDGLSHPRTQTDARATLLGYQYDLIGRLQRRFVKRPTDTQGLLEANWQYDLNNKPGTLGSMLGALDVAQSALDGAADYFHRDYQYDSLLRPWRVVTHVPANAGVWNSRDFAVEYGYDRYYGRVKAVGFPSTSSGPNGPATG
ncbi:MAG: hypothetical protein E6J58_00850, partial [Deltaproteobacteria bacterium]